MGGHLVGGEEDPKDVEVTGQSRGGEGDREGRWPPVGPQRDGTRPELLGGATNLKFSS